MAARSVRSPLHTHAGRWMTSLAAIITGCLLIQSALSSRSAGDVPVAAVSARMALR